MRHHRTHDVSRRRNGMDQICSLANNGGGHIEVACLPGGVVVALHVGQRSLQPGQVLCPPVDEWVARLIQRPIVPEKRQTLLDALGNKPDNADAVKKMIQLIVSMPEYQLC